MNSRRKFIFIPLLSLIFFLSITLAVGNVEAQQRYSCYPGYCVPDDNGPSFSPSCVGLKCGPAAQYYSCYGGGSCHPDDNSGTFPNDPTCGGNSSCSKTPTPLPTSVSAITKSGNITVASGNSGSASFAVKYSSETFYLYNGGNLLAQSTVTSSCTSDAAWDGTKCAVVPPYTYPTPYGYPTPSSGNTYPTPYGYPTPSSGSGYPTPSSGSGIINASSGGGPLSNPLTIYSGDSANLVWSTSTASCTSTGFDTAGAPSGNATVTPVATTTYTITCTGGVTGSVKIIVKKKPIFIEN